MTPWLRARLVEWARPLPPARPGAWMDPGVRRRWVGFLFPAAFVLFWLLNLAVGFETQTVGLDARIYYRGSAAWLAGDNPWAVGAAIGDRPFSYAGLPPTAILLAPFTLLPEDVFVWLAISVSVVAAVVIVRGLRLPFAWIAYPPLLYGVIAANPHVVLMALVVAGGTIGGVLATMIKVVAIPPLAGERRWLSLAVAATILGITVLVAPDAWAAFLAQAGRVADEINAQSGGGVSAWGNPPLMAATLAALAVLAVLDWRAAGWLAVPALFPTTQYYYAMFALPVDPVVAAASALPWPGVPALVTIGYAAVLVVLAVRRRRRGPSPAATSGSAGSVA